MMTEPRKKSFIPSLPLLIADFIQIVINQKLSVLFCTNPQQNARRESDFPAPALTSQTETGSAGRETSLK